MTGDTTSSLGEALRALPRPAADDAFTARVLARLDEAPEPAGSPRLVGGGRPTLWLLGGLATAALALVVGSMIFRQAVRPAVDGASPAPIEARATPPELIAAAPSEAAEEPTAVAASPALLSPRQSSRPVTVPTADPSATARRRALLAEVRSDLDALRREHRQLTAGLAELPEIGADGRPVMYVGGDEGLGLVVGAADRGAGGSASYPGGGASL